MVYHLAAAADSNAFTAADAIADAIAIAAAADNFSSRPLLRCLLGSFSNLLESSRTSGGRRPKRDLGDEEEKSVLIQWEGEEEEKDEAQRDLGGRGSGRRGSLEGFI